MRLIGTAGITLSGDSGAENTGGMSIGISMNSLGLGEDVRLWDEDRSRDFEDGFMSTRWKLRCEKVYGKRREGKG